MRRAIIFILTEPSGPENVGPSDSGPLLKPPGIRSDTGRLENLGRVIERIGTEGELKDTPSKESKSPIQTIRLQIMLAPDSYEINIKGQARDAGFFWGELYAEEGGGDGDKERQHADGHVELGAVRDYIYKAAGEYCDVAERFIDDSEPSSTRTRSRRASTYVLFHAPRGRRRTTVLTTSLRSPQNSSSPRPSSDFVNVELRSQRGSSNGCPSDIVNITPRVGSELIPHREDNIDRWDLSASSSGCLIKDSPPSQVQPVCEVRDFSKYGEELENQSGTLISCGPTFRACVATDASLRASTARRKDPSKRGGFICNIYTNDFTAFHNFKMPKSVKFWPGIWEGKRYQIYGRQQLDRFLFGSKLAELETF
ncbi:hypothetical protein B0H13DRAFT_1854791 [Mycena leptocephala]|nr:hypothetical protein B0H13DRAFT_1854791 [Mycena leptocephala]